MRSRADARKLDMRVLLLAEAANPEWVSVPLVGWSHSDALRRLVDAHVVTQVRNRQAILRHGWIEGRDFTAIDSEAVARWTYRLGCVLRGGSGKGWTTVSSLATLSNYYHEHLVWRVFGRRIVAGEFDLVHRLTPLSPTTPSPIAARCQRAGVPFVLGPLNGGLPWPRNFDHVRRAEREWLSYLRGAYKLLPAYRATLRHSAAILVGSRHTLAQIPAAYRHKCFYVPENAVDPARFTCRRTGTARRPVRLLFVGRLVPYKGADMLLEAAAPLVRGGAVTLQIIGDGPQMPRLRDMIRRLDLADGAVLSGWVDHAHLQAHMAEADVLAFPSVREFGGGVVLEAMAVGLVPVVVDYGGPGELVTPDSGVLVELGTRAQIIERFRAALADLAADPRQIDARSAAAFRRAHEQFTWSAKARQVVDVYDWVLHPRSHRPGQTGPDLQTPLPMEARTAVA
jgi:glycosyltransferase involved in cell wall biosynthesis